MKKDLEETLRWLRRAAGQGNTEAQYSLGVMYVSGRGVEKDYAAAMQWFRKAADQGNAEAQYNLGIMYEAGHGVEIDYAVAMQWFRRAADQGNADSQYNLGAMYKSGQGVKQDYAAAMQWFRRAADQGYAEAQYNLADMYHKEEFVEHSSQAAPDEHGLTRRIFLESVGMISMVLFAFGCLMCVGAVAGCLAGISEAFFWGKHGLLYTSAVFAVLAILALPLAYLLFRTLDLIGNPRCVGSSKRQGGKPLIDRSSGWRT